MTELPPQVLEDFKDFETNQPTGFVEGLTRSASNEFEEGFMKPLTAFTLDKFDSAPKMSEAEWKQSQYYREGLSFPNGLTERTAMHEADFYDKKQNYEATMQRMDNGFLRGTSRFVGDTLGFILGSYATGLEAIPIGIGKLAVPILDLFKEASVARRVADIGVGVTKGAAITAPQAIAEYKADQFYGEDPSIIEPLVTIGFGMGLGGLIHGITGAKRPVSLDSDLAAKEAAVRQMEAGKSVKVDDIIQHGAYSEDVQTALRSAERRASPEEVFTTAKADLETHQANLNELASLKLDEPTLTKLSETKTAEQVKLDKLQETLDKQQAKGIEATPEQQSAVQQSLEKIQAADEKLQLHEMAQKAESHLEDIKKQLEVLEGKAERKPANLAQEVNKLFEPLKLNRPTSELATTHYNNLQAARERLQNNVVSALLEDRQSAPLTHEQVKASAESINSYKNDSTYSEPAQRRYETEVEAAKDTLDENLADSQEKVKRAEESLSEQDKDLIAEAERNLSSVDKVESALKQIINCLMGE